MNSIRFCKSFSLQLFPLDYLRRYIEMQSPLTYAVNDRYLSYTKSVAIINFPFTVSPRGRHMIFFNFSTNRKQQVLQPDDNNRYCDNIVSKSS